MQSTSPRELRQKCCHRPKHAVSHSSLSVAPSRCCALHGRLAGRGRTGCWKRGRLRVETESTEFDTDHRIFNVRTDVKVCDFTRGCTDTVRESALKADSGRKKPSRTGESNLRERRADQTLYQLSYIPPTTTTTTTAATTTTLLTPSHVQKPHGVQKMMILRRWINSIPP